MRKFATWREATPPQMIKLVVEFATFSALQLCVPCDLICCLYPRYGNSDWVLLWTVFGELTVGSASCHRDLGKSSTLFCPWDTNGCGFEYRFSSGILLAYVLSYSKKSNCILDQWFVILVPTFPHRWWWCIWVPAHCGWQVVPLLYGFKVCDLVIGSGM